MQVTDQMLLAYQVDQIWNQITKDPRFNIRDPKTKERSYIFAIRRADMREVSSLMDIKQNFADAKSEEEKANVLQYANDTIGSDGSLYKNAQHGSHCKRKTPKCNNENTIICTEGSQSICFPKV